MFYYFECCFGGLLYNCNCFCFSTGCFDWSDSLNVSVVQPPESPLLLSSSTHSQKITKQTNKQPTEQQQRSVKRKGKHMWGTERAGFVITLILTAVGRVCWGAVQEARWAGHTQVGHSCVAIAVHAVADGVVVGLLRGAAGHVTTRRHTARVATVAHCGQKDIG